ncbi:unnamed protein product [Phyllotreta striolata]|uniref:Oxysterol-binding protein n=1 Tax=Phyllotreta striolata TaxID=444603 RepID=A0A9P0GQQ8_PHYSR|nr:unnamed protein product [Phyllotreta striolata]
MKLIKWTSMSRMATVENTKKSPQLSKIKLKGINSATVTASDSDASVETNSLSAESATEQNQTVQNEKKKKKIRRGSEWEIMEGLKDGQRFENKPNTFTGYLHKKRKWPLKGWHKRYFMLDKGILVYGKGPNEITKGKIHGTLDIGLSVISTKQKRKRIDIDAEEFIYHLKTKNDEIFTGWVQQLTAHRLYRQHVLTYGTNIGALFKPVDCINTLSRTPEILSRDGSLTRGLKPPNGGSRLTTWMQESVSSIEQQQRDASIIEQNISKLSRLLLQIESSNPIVIESTVEAVSPNVKKDRRKFGLKKKKSASSKGGSVDLSIQLTTAKSTTGNETENISPLSANSFSGMSASAPASTTLTTLPVPANTAIAAPAADTLSNVDVISLSAENQMRDDFITLSKQVINSLKSLVFSMSTERERLKSALESEMQVPTVASNQNIVTLKNSLNQVLQQNMDLKTRLVRIHEASDLADLSCVENLTENQQNYRNYTTSLSYSSSCVSATEFFDAEELVPDQKTSKYHGEEESEVRTRSESSSEGGSLTSEGEGSISSEESEIGVMELDNENCIDVRESQGLTGRRTFLPVPRPATEGLSLWNLLSRNIGKDLSQISMPVTLNEPLNVLQRLCEELEYSELLDRAASIDDPYERMVEVAAFAVSSYASTLSRAGNKPFNPLLGETYECIREDKGFRFISEQVSHHPPVSACYAESPNFTFWQDARVKTKFWGKSMEFQPLGCVNLLLPKTGDLYTWNKVTTCVHNLFSGQRWVDQYGELRISNGRITCKLTFAKASNWSSKRHEIVGAVYDEAGQPVHKLFGKWSESLYCGVAPSARCIWRAGTLPPNQELFYGFTRFAIELNELGPDSQCLPPTDTRFRPDQRALEEGDLNTAETLKLQLESMQRDRRKRREELNLGYEPRWFSCSQDDTWQYNGKYWDMRKNPGFANLQFESLW